MSSPNDAAINRLVTAVIVEQHDEWQVARMPLPRGRLDGPIDAAARTASHTGPHASTTRQLNMCKNHHAPEINSYTTPWDVTRWASLDVGPSHRSDP